MEAPSYSLAAASVPHAPVKRRAPRSQHKRMRVHPRKSGTAPRQWARGGGPSAPAPGPVTSATAALTDATHHAAAAAASAVHPSPPPASSLWNDYWHLESGGVQWRSEAERSAALLRTLEAHLQAPTPAAELEAKAKAKAQRKKARQRRRKAKAAAAAAAAAGGSADADADVVDLTGDSPTAAAASAASSRRSKAATADIESSSSSESEEEVDVARLLSCAHRAAFPSAVASLSLSAPAAPRAPAKSKRGKRRVIREEEDEGEGAEEKRETTAVDDDGGAEADAAMGDDTNGNQQQGASAAFTRATSDASYEALPATEDDVDLQSAGAELRGILSSFHASQRKAASRQKKKQAREDALFGRGGSAARSRKRGRRGGDYDRSASPSPPPIKRRRAQKTHRITAWKDEAPPKGRAAASAAAASASAASDSGVGLPIEERLRLFPSHFLCVGFLRLRPSGPVDATRLTSTPLRVAFAQKLLPLPPTAPASAVQSLDPEEHASVYVRSAEAESTEARERRRAAEAAKRAQARLRRQQESDEEDALAAGMQLPRAPAPPVDDTEEKTQATGWMQDELALSAPIIWHPSAVLDTHHVRPIQLRSIAPSTSSSSTAAAAAQAQPPSAPIIDSTTLDVLLALFTRQMIYLHPVYSPREQCFTLFVFLMPHAWQRAQGQQDTISGDDASVAPLPVVHRMESEAVCAQLKHVVAEWGCQARVLGGFVGGRLNVHTGRTSGSSGHFNPHALFESCRPPPVDADESHTPSAAPLALMLRGRGLRPTLRPYQKAAVAWMLLRERQPWGAPLSKEFRFAEIQASQLGLRAEAAKTGADEPAAMELDEEKEEEQKESDATSAAAVSAAPFRTAAALAAACRDRLRKEYSSSWIPCPVPAVTHPFLSGGGDRTTAAFVPGTVWLNEFTGAISARPPAEVESVEEVRGGVLADEMGLGKTVVTISLVLANPRHGSAYGHSTSSTQHTADLGGAVIPILPRTLLPSQDAGTAADAAASLAPHAAAVPGQSLSLIPAPVPIARPSLPAPPLLVDPLELSKKAYSFYQQQIADRDRTEGLAGGSAQANSNADFDDGEYEYGQVQHARPAPAPRREISCYCGHDSPFFHESGERLLECELCHTLQHAICMRMADPQQVDPPTFSPAFPYRYLCPTCSSLPATPKLPVAATLIVCPDVILAQWVDELARHVGPPVDDDDGNGDVDAQPQTTTFTSASGLRVLVYRGVRSSEDANAATSVDGTSSANLAAESELSFDTAPLAPAGPTYTVFVATEDFVSIRVQKPPAVPAAASGRGRKKRAMPAATRGARAGGTGRKSAPIVVEDGERVPASAVPTALPFSLVRPAQFSSWDIVLTTYSVLQQDLYHTTSDASQSRSARYAKKYRVLPTPLVGVSWWRIALDEAQMMGDGAARCAEMALLLSTVHRWNVTGTPIYKTMEGDLYGLLLFLGVLPYANRAYWRRVMASPYESGHPRARARMHALLGRLMWRNSKASVGSQLALPPTTTTVTRVHFTPIERYFYNKRREECRDASAYLRAHGRAALSSVQLRKVLHALLRLRQACVHPQIGSTHGLASLSKQTLTLSELSLAMLKDARLACEEIQRRSYFSMHGLAAIACIRGEWDAAVMLYERVVGGDERELQEEFEAKRAAAKTKPTATVKKQEEHESPADAAGAASSASTSAVIPSPAPNAPPPREIAIDALQKIHALHNLADALALKHGVKLDDIEPMGLEQEEEAADGGVEGVKGEEQKQEVGVKKEEDMEDVAPSTVDAPASIDCGSAAASSAAPSLSTSAAPPSAALAALPPAILRRIRLLRRFVSDQRALYLHKQALLVADAQAKFHSVHQSVHEHMHSAADGAGGARAAQSVAKARQSWWLDLLSRLAALPDLESRFVSLLRRDLLDANETTALDKTAQASRAPSIAESFRHATGLRFILSGLSDALENSRSQVTRKLRMQTLHQPPLDSEVRQSSHCARCRHPHQSGPLCVNCRSSSLLNEYEKLLYRFRVQSKNAYIVGGANTSTQLMLPGSASGRSRKELATIALLTSRERAQAAAAAGDSAAAAALAAEGGDEGTLEEERKQNLFQQDSELQSSLRILLKFCTEHRGELEGALNGDEGEGAAAAASSFSSASDSSLARTLQYGQDHLAQFELYKKELRAMLDLNRVHREQLSLYDELAMSSLRIRLRYEGEEVPPAERHFKLAPHELDQTQAQFEADIDAALMDQREWMGRLRFLESQVQEAMGVGAGAGASATGPGTTGDTGGSSICVICQEADLTLVPDIAVLPCAHKFCRSCISFMLSKRAEPDPAHMWAQLPPPGSKVSSIKCPQCRLKVGRREVLFVTNTKTAAKAPAESTGHVLGGAGADVDPAQTAGVSSSEGAATSDAAATPASTTAPTITTSSTAGGPLVTDPPLPVYPISGSWSSKIHAVLQRLMHILAMDATAKILLYSEWAESLLVFQQALRANGLRFLHIGGAGAKGAKGGGGGHGGRKRMHAQLALFKSSPSIPLLLLPLTSAASGLNIVEASHLVLVEPSLSPGKELQAVGRIVRIGQVRQTFVHRFLIVNSVEERIFAMNAAQRDAAHKAEQRHAYEAAGRNNAEGGYEHEEEEEGEGDVLLGARGRGEDALDAGDFARLLDGDEDQAEESKEEEGVANAAPTAASEAQEDAELRAALEESTAMAHGDARSAVPAPDGAVSSVLSPGVQPVPSSDVAAGAGAPPVSSSSLALPASEAALLASVRAEASTAAAHHRFWSSVVLMAGGGGGAAAAAGGRRVTRLQALVTLQRLEALQPAAKRRSPAEAAQQPPTDVSESKEDSPASPTAEALVPFQGKMLTPRIVKQLQALPLAPAVENTT